MNQNDPFFNNNMICKFIIFNNRKLFDNISQTNLSGIFDKNSKNLFEFNFN